MTAFAAALAVFLAGWNNVANTVPAFHRWYVLVNLGLSAGLVIVANAVGLTWAELGLAAAAVPAGLVWGGGAAVLVAAGLLLGRRLPLTAGLYRDARVLGLPPSRLWWLAGVRIPLGTVVLEEVAFRAVLLASWTAVAGTAAGVAAQALVFAVWHITPTRLVMNVNGVTDRRRRLRIHVVTLMGMAAAAAVLAGLRLASGSLLAPVLAHAASNIIGALLAARMPPSADG